MNLIELYDNTKKLAAWRASYAQNQQWNLKNVIPFAGTHTLLFQATCFGETEHSEHVVNIQFSGVEYSEEKHPDFKEIEYKEEKYWFKRPTLKSECTVRCSCSDFQFRWAWSNKKHKALFGSVPKKYKRKTTTRPPVNPDHIPGICKHVFQLQAYLKHHDYME